MRTRGDFARVGPNGVCLKWFRDRALTLVSMAMFLLFLVGQVITGFYEYNASEREHSERCGRRNHRWR